MIFETAVVFGLALGVMILTALGVVFGVGCRILFLEERVYLWKLARWYKKHPQPWRKE
jgi:hypothetical protein